MSPKPADRPAIDPDRALATLRAERPSDEVTERARAALKAHKEGRRSIARPLAATLIAAALAAVILTPRAHDGAAWAQTVMAMRQTPLSHSVNREANGKVSLEEWRAPGKRATVLYTRGGSVLWEMRTDGRRTMSFFDWFDVANRRKQPLAANAVRYATVAKGAHPDLFADPVGSVDDLLNDPEIKVIAHEESKNGNPEIYRLQRTYRFVTLKNAKPIIHETIAEVDPTTRRIRALVSGKSRKLIEYPDSIPDAVFEPKPQVAKVATVLDQETELKAVQRTLRQGIAKDGPITLRALLLDGDGALWAFWTGAVPGGRLSHPVRFSVPCGPAYGLKAYTSDWRKTPAINGKAIDPAAPRLGGMARVPKVKLGPTVDVEVPYPGGVARFKAVRPVRISMINAFDQVLGIRREYR